MNPNQIADALGDHIWQSTACFVVAAGLAWFLRRSPARARFAVWMAASLKWLVPFEALRELGALIPWEHPVVAAVQSSTVAFFVQPFAAEPAAFLPATPTGLPVTAAATPFPVTHPFPWAAMALVVWAGGCALVVAFWAYRWIRVARIVRRAEPVAGLPLGAVRTSAMVEPGVFGILRPTLILPAGLADRLTPHQLDAVIAHELCHVRRRDNLWATLHMLAEALFWFHPFVWWTGRQLLETRELACDEAVLAADGDPESYAQGLLLVCREAAATPLACVSGVSGGDLKRRIAAIFGNGIGRRLALPARVALFATALVAIGMPVAIGLGHGRLTAVVRHAIATVAPSPLGRATSPAESATPATVTRGGSQEIAAQQVDTPTSTPVNLSASDPGTLFTQTPQAPAPHFVWASISVGKPGEEPGAEGLFNDGPRFEGSTMLEMIRLAYGEHDDHRIVGGPPWIDTDLYDLRAKAPDGATMADVRVMLQGLLKERFRLATHTEQRPLPAYALTINDKGKLKPAANPETPGQCALRQPTQAELAARQAARQAGTPLRSDLTVDCTNETMAALAANLPGITGAAQYLMDRPFVVDQTGASGGFDFSLVFMSRLTLQMPSAAAYDPHLDLSLDDALAKFGLALQTVDAPQPAIVVDSVAEKPLDIPDSLVGPPPVLPAEFEAASIKPHAGGRGGPARVTPGGEVDIRGFSLSQIVINALGLDGQRVVNMPPWAGDEQFDITAKTVPGVTLMADVEPMMLALVKQRFQLAVHQETQTIPVYSLRVIDRSKLTPAAAGERYGCGNPAITMATDGGFTCTRTTMAQLAQFIFFYHSFGYTGDLLVVNMTGINGAYDVTLRFGRAGAAGRGRGATDATASGTGEPEAPSGDLTLFQALEKLGLKLEKDKQPVQVTVIDHIERIPSGN